MNKLFWESVRIRNLLPDPDPELEVVDPAPGPELDLNLIKNIKKIRNVMIMTLKVHITLTFSLKSMTLVDVYLRREFP
jgi:hypothetical protein